MSDRRPRQWTKTSEAWARTKDTWARVADTWKRAEFVPIRKPDPAPEGGNE